MFKKVYEYLKQFIIENYLSLTFLVLFASIITYPVPYYIYSGGGTMDVDTRIEFNGKTKSNGSYNMCYVEEYKANVLFYLLSYVMPGWEKEKEEEVLSNSKETIKDVNTRDKIYLETGNNSALITAFNYANKDLKIIDNKVVILYISEKANTNLKIGDEILSIENKNISSVEDIANIINNKNLNDKVIIKVKNNNKEYDRFAYIINYENKKKLGISLTNKQTIKTDPKITFNFKDNESGPSGGLILSLAIYDYLVDEDISKGLKITGTGTIDDNGNVGEIGGVKYKLKGAVKKHADIFFVPNGDNYKEAIKLKKEKKYNIEVVGVDTFEEALNYLKEHKN